MLLSIVVEWQRWRPLPPLGRRQSPCFAPHEKGLGDGRSARAAISSFRSADLEVSTAWAPDESASGRRSAQEEKRASDEACCWENFRWKERQHDDPIPKTKAELESLVLAAVRATHQGDAVARVLVSADDTGTGWLVRAIVRDGSEVHLTMVEGVATRLRRLYSLAKE